MLGGTGDPRKEADKATGAVYDPRTDTWRMLPEAPLQVRHWHTAVWNGTTLVVWGGTASETQRRVFNDGATYDPGLNRWTPLAPSPLKGRCHPAGVVTNEAVLIWGGTADCGTPGASNLNDGASLVF